MKTNAPQLMNKNYNSLRLPKIFPTAIFFISMNLKNIAVGSIWDPVAVSLCCAAGEKANIDLRFGGKVSSLGGSPINKRVLVKKIVRNAFQSFGKSFVPMGDSVCINFDGIEVILNSNRSHTFSTDLFTEL